jgi:6-phosphogluconolactonase
MPVTGDGQILDAASRIQHTGSSVNAERQAQPHPHWIGTSPDNRFVLVPDLGLDQVVIYRLDAERHTLERHGAGELPPGSGPRHLKFHPNGQWVYVVNELGLTVSAFRFDATQGSLARLQTVPAIAQSQLKTETSGSEIRIHPSGKFLYAGLRGHDVVAVFAIDPNSGLLTLVEHEPVRGSWPRNFGIDPTGQWLLAAGAESSTVAVFRIDQDTGKLVFTRRIIHVPQPICVEFHTVDGGSRP